MTHEPDDVPPESPDCWAEGTPVPRPRRVSRGGCPRCRIPLSQRIVGDLDLDQCLGCAGVFVTDLAATQLVLGGADRAVALEALRLLDPATRPPATAPIAWCPACARPMLSRPLGGARVLVCREHGLWIDREVLEIATRTLVACASGKAAALERAAFGDLTDRRRWGVLLGHARAIRTPQPQGALGLLAQLFGGP